MLHFSSPIEITQNLTTLRWDAVASMVLRTIEIPVEDLFLLKVGPNQQSEGDIHM